MSAHLQLVPLHADHLPAAARIFVERLAAQRQVVPHLPEREPDAVVELLARMVATDPAVAAPPISVHIARRRDAAFHRAWLAAPDHWVWLAEIEGAPVGYVRAQADADDVAWVVQSPDVLANSGAYVLPEHRCRGVATALVDETLALARALGKRACSVDFESQNDPAFGFWPRHFTPVCVSVLRRIDPRGGALELPT